VEKIVPEEKTNFITYKTATRHKVWGI